MSTPLILAISSTPLACYFWVLAMWHGGRHPRVVTGRADFLTLAAGVGGLIAFGPFGQFLVRRVFGEPSASAWIALVLALALLAMFLARRARNRLVIYHIDPQTLDTVLEQVLEVKWDRFRRTVSGFEDQDATVALTVESSRRFHYAVVEARGPRAEAITDELAGLLKARVRSIPVAPTPVAWWLLALSALTMGATLAAYFVVQPSARDAFHLLLRRLTGR
jgi:hypothetical protein